MASGVPTSTISDALIATAPGDSTWCCAFWVTTVPPTTIREIGRRAAGCTARATDASARLDSTFLALDCIVNAVPLRLVEHPLVHDALVTLRAAVTPPE